MYLGKLIVNESSSVNLEEFESRLVDSLTIAIRAGCEVVCCKLAIEQQGSKVSPTNDWTMMRFWQDSPLQFHLSSSSNRCRCLCIRSTQVADDILSSICVRCDWSIALILGSRPSYNHWLLGKILEVCTVSWIANTLLVTLIFDKDLTY
jgi:hypothetical protein